MCLPQSVINLVSGHFVPVVGGWDGVGAYIHLKVTMFHLGKWNTSGIRNKVPIYLLSGATR